MTSESLLENKYQGLMDQAKEKAEFKFDATLVQVEKNVLLMRKHVPTFSESPFLTVKVNLHQLSFYDGHYDMAFEEAVNNFKQRVENSAFNYTVDIPAETA